MSVVAQPAMQRGPAVLLGELVQHGAGERLLLTSALTIIAGLTSLCLLLGFPAVAWQFRRFGMPLELAPDRAFLIAGVPPTLAFLVGEYLSRRMPRINLTDGKSAFALFRQMGAFTLPMICVQVRFPACALLLFAASG